MPEHIRALMIALMLATAVFVAVASPARTLCGGPGDFERRRNLWYGITLAGFLSHNFWLFLLIAGVLLYRATRKEANVAATVLFVLLAMPLFGKEIPGFAGIRYLFKITYLHLISIVVLLPIFVREIRKQPLEYLFDERAGIFLYSYLILDVLLTMVVSGGDGITGVMRTIVMSFLGIVVPFAVFSRQIKDDDALRVAIGCYIVGAAVMAAVGIVEASKHWLLYTSLQRPLGWEWGTLYLKRGDALRAFATAGQPIPYGYAMAVGLMLMLGLKRYFQRKFFWWSGMALLFGGMLAAYSRGPWVGAVAGFLVFVLTGPQRWANLGKLAIAGLVGGAIMIATPLGDKLYQSTVVVDEGNIDYRVQVFEVSMRVILQNPIFGSKGTDFISQLEELRQGQGIIDIVNSYIAVALSNGFVGLFLFIGFFASGLFAIIKRMRATSDKGSQAIDLGRSLLAALVCILVTIYTVSGISVVPTIYYLTTALAVAYSRSQGGPQSQVKVPANLPKKGNVNRLARGRFRYGAMSR